MTLQAERERRRKARLTPFVPFERQCRMHDSHLVLVETGGEVVVPLGCYTPQSICGRIEVTRIVKVYDANWRHGRKAHHATCPLCLKVELLGAYAEPPRI